MTQANIECCTNGNRSCANCSHEQKVACRQYIDTTYDLGQTDIGTLSRQITTQQGNLFIDANGSVQQLEDLHSQS